MLTQKKIFLNILTVALRLCHMFDVEKNNALGHYDYYSQVRYLEWMLSLNVDTVMDMFVRKELVSVLIWHPWLEFLAETIQALINNVP